MSAVQEMNFRAEVARTMSSERFEYTERDLLIRLSEQVKNLTDETRRSAAGIASDVRDHEARLRILENFRWYLVGAGCLAGFLAGSLVALVAHFWH